MRNYIFLQFIEAPGEFLSLLPVHTVAYRPGGQHRDPLTPRWNTA